MSKSGIRTAKLWTLCQLVISSTFNIRHSTFVFLAILAWIVPAGIARAAGDTFTLVGHDLQVDVDSRWIGCGQGGYCPVRVRVVNRGPSRTLTFRIAKTYQSLPVVKQTMEVPQNATIGLTLSVPMVNDATSGEFRVEDQGGVLTSMQRSVSLPEANHWEQGRLGCLVVASGVVDLQPLEDGVSTIRGAGGSISGGYHGSRTASAVTLPAISLPSSWVDYSGVDLISVSFETLAKLPRETRTALIQWTRCGGTLLVTAAGDSPRDVDALAKVLDADATSWSWLEAKSADREVGAITRIDASGGVSSTGPPPQDIPGEWPRATAPFRMTDVGFGKLVMFRGEAFPGTAQDWFWLLKSIGGLPRWEWGTRHGLSSRMGNGDFLFFLIPGIGGVPVVMFLVLITIFSVVIGPMNYFVLAKRKKLHLLILTIPAIAFVTSLLLLGYTTVAHGFSVKARSRSLTYVDQRAQAAVTFNRLSLFAGQAPSSGLRFSRDTAVFPIWPEGEGFEAGQVDWTETQALTSGWLRSRTRTQFLTVGHRTERGRLEVKPQGADRLVVANGFEWGFEQLIVVGEQGQLFLARDLHAGDSIVLQPATIDELQKFSGGMQRNKLDLPSGMTGGGGPNSLIFGSSPAYSRRHIYSPYGTPVAVWHFHSSLMEQTWSRLQSPRTDAVGEPRTYWGLTAQRPNLVELGVLKATEVAGSHVVMGKW